jgi:hypothetical protein
MLIKLFSAGMIVAFAGSVSAAAVMQASQNGMAAALFFMMAGLVSSLIALLPREGRGGGRNIHSRLRRL